MRPLNILRAPTSLGNRPYETDGTARLTTLGPSAILGNGLLERLGARDLGEIAAADYRDFTRPPGGIRNEQLVLDHVRRIASALETATDQFTLVLGGDCSVLLGCLLGLSRQDDLGLIFIDAHSDFSTPETSTSGAVAGMHLAFSTGRGNTELARLRNGRALLREENIVAIGVRDGDFGQSGIRTARDSAEALSYLPDRDFFIHLDVDVLDPSLMPFVDSPEPGGFDPSTLTSLLRPLVGHPRAVGILMAIYDPRDDRDRHGARLLANILERSFGS